MTRAKNIRFFLLVLFISASILLPTSAGAQRLEFDEFEIDVRAPSLVLSGVAFGVELNARTRNAEVEEIDRSPSPATFCGVPPAGFEPAHTAPEAVALSPELWGLALIWPQAASANLPASRSLGYQPQVSGDTAPICCQHPPGFGNLAP